MKLVLPVGVMLLGRACPNALKEKVGRGFVCSLDRVYPSSTARKQGWNTQLPRLGQMVACPLCTRKHAVLPLTDGQKLSFIRCGDRQVAVALEGRRLG